MRIFYVYPVPGELGWLLFNFLPHMQYKFGEGSFDEAIVHVRRGYEGLYRFPVTTTTVGFDYFVEYTEGNAFVLQAPKAYDRYKQHCDGCDKEVQNLTDAGHDVTTLRLPLSRYRMHRYKDKHKRFEPLLAPAPWRDKWSHRIAHDAVIFHLRHIPRSKQKNTSTEMYNAAYAWAEKNGKQFVTVGNTQGLEPKFPVRGLDLLNSTDLNDLIAIWNLGGMVVGSSSGPMHLSSLTRTPHIVWGGGRSDVRKRYVSSWNPFSTMIKYLDMSFNFKDTKRLKQAMSELSRAEEADAERRSCAAD